MKSETEKEKEEKKKNQINVKRLVGDVCACDSLSQIVLVLVVDDSLSLPAQLFLFRICKVSHPWIPMEKAFQWNYWISLPFYTMAR